VRKRGHKEKKKKDIKKGHLGDFLKGTGSLVPIKEGGAGNSALTLLKVLKKKNFGDLEGGIGRPSYVGKGTGGKGEGEKNESGQVPPKQGIKGGRRVG